MSHFHMLQEILEAANTSYNVSVIPGGEVKVMTFAVRGDSWKDRCDLKCTFNKDGSIDKIESQ